MPKYSVISPVYNTSEYLRPFIDSVIGQTFADFELILVDDGSTDNSLDICREYAGRDSRVKVLTQKNQGAGFARNNGIEHALGDYLIFFDSDDYADVTALEVIDSALNDKKTDLLIFGAYEVIDTKKGAEVSPGRAAQPTEVYTRQECRELFGSLLFSSVLNPPWNKVYSRDMIERHCIRFADTRRAQDAFFNMDYFCRIDSLRVIGDRLYYYREVSQATVWKKYPKDIYLIDIRYNARVKELLEEFGCYDGENRKQADKWFFNSVARGAGLFRNPRWKLSSSEKYEYVEQIITHPYNRERAQTAWTPDARTEQIKQRILNADVKGMMKDVLRDARRDSAYELYCRTLRRALKRGKA